MSNKSPIFDNNNYGVANTTGVTGVLSRLWRTVLMDMGYTPNQYEIALNEASKRAKLHSKDSRLSKVMSVANLRRELESPSMTWKVFIKGMRILKVTKLEVAIKITLSTGKNTIHSVNVDLGGPVDINEYTGM